jgi:xanthine phosphoribosyltransferase
MMVGCVRFSIIILSCLLFTGAFANKPKPIIRKIEWNEIERASSSLVDKLKNKSWKGILIVARGGLAPAHLLAQKLNIRKIETICIESYEDKKQTPFPKILKLPKLKNEGEGWIVVDDISDTGRTFKIIREYFPKAYYVSFYTKPKGQHIVDIAYEKVDQNVWVQFPWEVD